MTNNMYPLKKAFPQWLHWSHGNGFSPVCTLWCFIRRSLCEKLLSHWSHVNGFSPVCTLWCFIRRSVCEKLLSHWSHGNGFSPVCTLWCFIRVDLSEKLLSHWSHGNGFSPVCTMVSLKRFVPSDLFIYLIIKLVFELNCIYIATLIHFLPSVYK